MSSLGALVAAAVLVPILWASGLRVFRLTGLAPETPAERFGLGFATGCSLLYLAVLLLSVLRLATPPAFTLVLLALAGIGYPVFRGLPAEWFLVRRTLPARGWPGWIPAVTAAFVLLALVLALAPPTGIDSLRLYLVGAKRIVQEGGLTAGPELWFRRSGGLTLLYVPCLALQGDLLAKLLNFAVFAACMALVAATAARLAPGAGRWGAALFAASPLTVGLWGYEWLEPGALLQAAAAACSLVAYLRGRDPRWLGAALAFSGFGPAFKTSAYAVLTVGAAALLLAVRDRVSRPWIPVAAGSMIGAAGLLAWPLWTYFARRSLLGDYLVAPGAPLTDGTPQGMMAVALALADMLRQILTFSEYWTDSPGPLLWLGVAAVVCFRRKSDEGFLAGVFLASLVVHFGFLAVASPSYLRPGNVAPGRYSSPCLLAFGIPVAASFARAAELGPAWLGAGFRAAFLILAAPLLFLKGGKAAVAVPVVLGLESRDAYLAKKIETYEACRVVNALPGTDARVLFLADRPYFLDRPFVSIFDQRLASVSDLAGLLPLLRSLGITHVLVQPRNLAPWAEIGEALRSNPLFREIGSWPYRYQERVRLFEVLPAPP